MDKNDRPPPKRFQTQNERDIVARKNLRDTPRGGYSIPEVIDDDLTPAPQSPPSRELTDQMTPEERLATLEAAGRQNAAVLAHEQRARREGEERGREIGKIEEKLASLAGLATATVRVIAVVDETLVPALRNLTQDMRGLLEERQLDAAMRKQMNDTLARLMQEIGKFDERSQNTSTQLALLSQRMDALSTNVTDKITSIRIDHTARMEGLAEQFGSEITELKGKVSKLEGKTIAIDKRQAVSTALTKGEKVTLTGIGSVIAGGVAWAIEHLASLFGHGHGG